MRIPRVQQKVSLTYRAATKMPIFAVLFYWISQFALGITTHIK